MQNSSQKHRGGRQLHALLSEVPEINFFKSSLFRFLPIDFHFTGSALLNPDTCVKVLQTKGGSNAIQRRKAGTSQPSSRRRKAAAHSHRGETTISHKF